MEAQTLQAEVRETRGKGPARQLRMRGLIPAIYYGPGVDPVKLTVSPADLTKALKGAYGRNQVLELAVGNEKMLSLVKDLEVDPATRELLHADFYAITADRPVETNVPFVAEGRAIGVQRGGVVRKAFRELPIRAVAQNVPATITTQIDALDVGDVVTVADLELPDGVEVTYPPQRRVLVIEAKEREEEEEEGESEGEGEGA